MRTPGRGCNGSLSHFMASVVEMWNGSNENTDLLAFEGMQLGNVMHLFRENNGNNSANSCFTIFFFSQKNIGDVRQQHQA